MRLLTGTLFVLWLCNPQKAHAVDYSEQIGLGLAACVTVAVSVIGSFVSEMARQSDPSKKLFSISTVLLGVSAGTQTTAAMLAAIKMTKPASVFIGLSVALPFISGILGAIDCTSSSISAIASTILSFTSFLASIGLIYRFRQISQHETVTTESRLILI